MSLDAPVLSLKHTNVSKPQLQHTNSKQSITASEDYYSFSEVSSEGDDRSQRTVIRYATPPSRLQSPPNASYEKLGSQSSLGSLNGTKKRAGVSPLLETTPEIVRPDSEESDEITRHRSIPSSYRDVEKELLQPPPGHPMDSRSPATTPGVDETPYIRFAIDQLTRDEEVRGSRQYTGVDSEESDGQDYPVDRIISDGGVRYVGERPASQAGPSAPQTRHARAVSHVREDSPVGRDIFVPYHPGQDSLQHPALDFLPGVLRITWLGIFILLCLAMLSLLLASAIYSSQHDGICDYTGFGGSRYFVFQYLPTMLGMVILLWLLQIQSALQRIAPFIALASDNAGQRSEGIFLDYFPTQYLLPKFQFFHAGQPLLGACSVIFWLSIFTIPLLASSYNVRRQSDADGGQWRWIAVQGIVWTVIGLYVFLVCALNLLAVALFRKQTGLKWDPRSLADIIALLERSNIMGDYDGSEMFEGTQDFRNRLQNRSDRLSYWHTTKRPNDIFYGIGEEGGATRRYSIEQGRIREKAPERSFKGPDADVEGQPSSGGYDDIRSPRLRLRYLPWFLRDTWVAAWIVITFILLIAFLIVSFVNRAVGKGFLPLVPVGANSSGFSASNFLYSFVPAIIGTLLFLFWNTLDLTFRRLAPFAALTVPHGATAEQSLLLDYSARLPISLTIAAIVNKHYRIAFLSIMTLISSTLPVLAGGCFWTQFYVDSHEYRVAAHPPAYYTMCVFLALYAATLSLVFPSRRPLALPHPATTLSEIISFLYQSPLASDRAFARPATKAELVTRLLGPELADRFNRSVLSLVSRSQRNLAESSRAAALGAEDAEAAEKRQSVVNPGAIRYGFGVFLGRDGREHLGVERVRRGGNRELIMAREARGSWIGR